MRLAASLALLGPALLAAPSAAQLVFDSPSPVPTGGMTVRILAGDLNEDGLQDLVTGHFFFGGKPKLILGTAPGQFAAPQELPVGEVWDGPVRLADFDEDGHLDLLDMWDVQPSTSLSVLFGHGDATFEAPLGINGAFENPIDADVGDFDADGHLDVAIYNGSHGFSMGSVLAVFGDGDGSFDEPVTITPSSFAFGASGVLRVGDVNGDGFDDVVLTVAGLGMPSILSNGDGTFTQAPCSGCSIVSAKDFELGDLNGDGREDLVSPTTVLLANAGGTFDFAGFLPNAFVPLTVALADLDADGRLDAIVGRNYVAAEFDPGQTAGDVHLMRGNGNGTFQLPGVVVSHVPQPRDIAVADIDLDGRLDLALAEMESTTGSGARTIANRTYGPGSPFLDLGGALAGTNGYPIQIASGTLVAGQPFSFRLASGPPSGQAWHIVGLAALNAPFKGGTLIPAVALVNGPFPLDGTGGLNLAGNWPSGGSGLTLWAQYWMPAGGGPAGFVASSGVRAQIP